MADIELSLVNSINTSSPDEDLKPFSQTDAPYIRNTGIERDGGITNIYVDTTEYAEDGEHFISDDNKVISISDEGDYGLVKLDGKSIGAVSNYGVDKHVEIAGAEDVALTADDSYVTAVVSAADVIVTEYSLDGVQLNERTITFPSLADVASFYTSFSIVRYQNMHFVDLFEFALRIGDQVIIMSEATPNDSFATAMKSSQVLGGVKIAAMVTYMGQLVVAGNGGRVGSYDGAAWKNYDGSGQGLGVYSAGVPVGSANITSMVVHGSSLVIGSVGGRLASYNGARWINYNDAGTGVSILANNATAVSTDNITAMLSYSFAGIDWLIIGGLSKIASWNGSAWCNYNVNNNGAIASPGIRSTSLTSIGNAISKFLVYRADYQSADTIVALAAAGCVGSFMLGYAAPVSIAVTGFAGSTQLARYLGQKDGLHAIYDYASTSGYVATSRDGITWTSTRIYTGALPADLSYADEAHGDFLMRYQTAGSDGVYLYTNDLVNWRQLTFTGIRTGNLFWTGSIYNFMGVDSTGTLKIWSSPDAITWTLIYTDATTDLAWDFTQPLVRVSGSGPDRLFSYKNLAAPGSLGIIYSMDLGVSWTRVVYSGALTPYGAAYIGTLGSGAAARYLFRTTNSTQTTALIFSVDASFADPISANPGFIVTAAAGRAGESIKVLGITSLGTMVLLDTYASSTRIYTSRSTNNGVSWTMVGPISPIAVTPHAPAVFGYKFGNLYIGSGAAQFGQTFEVYMSGDDGLTWNIIPALTDKNAAAPWGDVNGFWVIGGSLAVTGLTWMRYITRDGINWITTGSSGPGGSIFSPVSIENNEFLGTRYGSTTTGTFHFSRSSGYAYGYLNLSDVALQTNQFPRILCKIGNYVVVSTGPSRINSCSINGSMDICERAPAGAVGFNYPPLPRSYGGTTSGDFAPVGASAITSAVIYQNRIVLAAADGRVGSYGLSPNWYDIPWKTYDNIGTGTGLFSNAGIIGANAINTMLLNGSKLVMAGGLGRVSSYDGANWKYYDGTGIGTGPWANGNLMSNNAITCSEFYQNKYVFGNDVLGLVGTINNDNTINPFYTSTTGTYVDNLLVLQASASYLYVYRYENGLYLVNLVANSLNRSHTLNKNTLVVGVLNAAWAIPEVKDGFTRHILTTLNPDITTIATQVRAWGYVGFTDFVTFSPVATYSDMPFTSNSILSKAASFGYQEFNFRLTASATDVYNYAAPAPSIAPDVSAAATQSNTNTLSNYYGKLTNNAGVPSSKPFEFRLGMIPALNNTTGIASFLSVAVTDGEGADNLGVLITNVGEFDESYTPQIQGDCCVLYRFNRKFYITSISETPKNRIQRVTPNLYKVNTITPLNLIDVDSELLYIGSSDYNGRARYLSSAIPSASSTAIVHIQSSLFSNSIDVGDKLVTYSTIAAANFEIIGYKVPYLSIAQGYSVDTYVADTYMTSTLNEGSELVDVAKVDSLYLNTPASPKIIPEAIGLTYDNGVIHGDDTTYFLEPDYDGYRIGNEVEGSYDVFSLNNGYTYIYDGQFVYSISVDNVGFITSKRKLAAAAGLRYIASAPTEAYFMSDFDNSLYVFTGGQSLTKAKRFNRLSNILKGVYSTRDNTLLLDCVDDLVWIRDEVITRNAKVDGQALIRLYNTTSGIVIGNDIYDWRYNFKPTLNSIAVPLRWQSSFFSQTLNTKSIVTEVVYTIYDESKSAHVITGYIYTRDPDTYAEQTDNWIITPSMYVGAGYLTLRMNPTTMKSSGISFGLGCDDKILILDATIKMEEDTAALLAPQSIIGSGSNAETQVRTLRRG